jgi:metal-responsive CopG/Arc/MetJ family transcriptional regulator
MVNVRLPVELVKYLENYQSKHGLASRTQTIIKAIEQLRALELIEGYKALKTERQRQPDPLADLGSGQAIAPSDEETW